MPHCSAPQARGIPWCTFGENLEQLMPNYIISWILNLNQVHLFYIPLRLACLFECTSPRTRAFHLGVKKGDPNLIW